MTPRSFVFEPKATNGVCRHTNRKRSPRLRSNDRLPRAPAHGSVARSLPHAKVTLIGSGSGWPAAPSDNANTRVASRAFRTLEYDFKTLTNPCKLWETLVFLPLVPTV